MYPLLFHLAHPPAWIMGLFWELGKYTSEFQVWSPSLVSLPLSWAIHLSLEKLAGTPDMKEWVWAVDPSIWEEGGSWDMAPY